MRLLATGVGVQGEDRQTERTKGVSIAHTDRDSPTNRRLVRFATRSFGRLVSRTRCAGNHR
jgi:hypothetical protein